MYNSHILEECQGKEWVKIKDVKEKEENLYYSGNRMSLEKVCLFEQYLILAEPKM